MTNTLAYNNAVFFICKKSFTVQNFNCSLSFVRKDHFYRFVNSKAMKTRWLVLFDLTCSYEYSLRYEAPSFFSL
jgi:hypothetical protein